MDNLTLSRRFTQPSQRQTKKSVTPFLSNSLSPSQPYTTQSIHPSIHDTTTTLPITMLVNSLIRRKILSLLQPWLREEPHLDLKLGFFHSLAVITNLRFDVFVLNKLFHSPPLLFIKDLTVERLVVRFSTWSPPAFYVEFHGVQVVLALE